MANIGYDNVAPPQEHRKLRHTASVACDPGDLVYLADAANGYVSPSDQLSDQGTAALTQRLFASLFAGVSASRQVVTNATAGAARLLQDVVVTAYPCESMTCSVNDYFAVSYSSGLPDAQKLVKTTDPTLAVARANKAVTSAATTVDVRITARRMPCFAPDAAQGTFTAPPAASASAAGGTLSWTGGDGYPATSGAASAGGPANLLAGSGGLATSGTAGAPGIVTVGGTAAGGNATTGTPGAGSDTRIRSQAGGNATAGSGNGGAAGNVNLIPASGGTSSGGTAGANGAVQVNGAGFIPVTFTYDPLGNKVTQAIFTAVGLAYRVRKIIVRPRTLEGTALTMSVLKANSGTAISAGTVLHSGTANLNANADTNQSLTLSATASDLIVADGYSVGFTLSTTLGTGTGTITLLLEPMG